MVFFSDETSISSALRILPLPNTDTDNESLSSRQIFAEIPSVLLTSKYVLLQPNATFEKTQKIKIIYLMITPYDFVKSTTIRDLPVGLRLTVVSVFISSIK